MADDIDDLLSEVENKFCNKSKSSTVQKATKHKVNDSSKLKGDATSSINAMVDDILDDDLLDNVEGKPHKKATKSHSVSGTSVTAITTGAGLRKCFPVFLGGSMHAEGLATAVNKRTCDQLRCTDCDFKISTFDNFQWKKDTDYLFLRNNMPDFDRLKSKLTPKKGLRAYACQCKWKSVDDLETVEAGFKWVCGKH